MAKQKQSKSTATASKKTPAKAARTKQVSARSKKSPATAKIAPEQRRQMIAEAAYYIAEQRGFYGGDTVRDWLLAETEIDRRLATY
jgi:hypothetical protein